MTDQVIRLDTSRPHSECRGDRLHDDPHYGVCFWQGQMVKKAMILLPFDAQGELVPDDGKTASWQGLNSDGKPVTHFPLYNKPMRDLVDAKRKKMAEAKPEDEDDEDEIQVADDDVNFVSWLKGEARYDWASLQVAGKKRFSQVWQSKQSMVEDLVLDHKILPQSQVCAALAKHIMAHAGVR